MLCYVNTVSVYFGFLKCVDTVGWVMWHVEIFPTVDPSPADWLASRRQPIFSGLNRLIAKIGYLKKKKNGLFSIAARGWIDTSYIKPIEITW